MNYVWMCFESAYINLLHCVCVESLDGSTLQAAHDNLRVTDEEVNIFIEVLVNNSENRVIVIFK